MPRAADIENEDGDEVLTLPGQEEGATEPEDNGNTPDPEPAKKPAKAAAEPEAEPDLDDETTKPKFIPKGRFDEVNERMKAVERQNAELIAALAANKPAAPAAAPAPSEAEFDMKATIKARNLALASGDDDKALELDEQIQAHTLKEARRLAREDMEAATTELTAKQQETEMKRAAAELVKAYPQLDPNSPDVDQDAIDFVVARRNKLIGEGRPMHEALRMAVDVAAKRFFTDPEADPSPTKPDPATARVIAARKAAAEAAALQPPALSGKGDRSTVKERQNVETMSDDEFAALSDAEKKRLRGDA